MPKKSKGRGRSGKGRGAESQVGQAKASNEPTRPGASNAAKNQPQEQGPSQRQQERQPCQVQTEEQKPPQAQRHEERQGSLQDQKQPQRQEDRQGSQDQKLPQRQEERQGSQPQTQEQKPPMQRQQQSQASQAQSEKKASVQDVSDRLNKTSLHDDGMQASGLHTEEPKGQKQKRKTDKGKQMQQKQVKEQPGPSGMASAQNIPPQTHTGQQSNQASSQPSPDATASSDGRRQRSQQNVPQVIASGMSEEKASHLKRQVPDLPRRPGYGDLGKAIKLKANFFKLDFRSVHYLYHYDIEIKPDKTPVSECREVVNTAVNKYLHKYFEKHYPAFDGRRNMYSREKLPSINGQGVELEVRLPGVNGGKDRNFKLTVKYAAQVRVDDLNEFLDAKCKVAPEAIQALDIVLRQIPSLHFTPVGRSFFPLNMPGQSLGGGCEVRTGFYQSIRHSQWKTMLVNIDVSSKGFMKAQPVIDFLYEILRDSAYNKRNIPDIANRRWQMDRSQEKQFIDAIKGFRVETTHIPGIKRKYLVQGLGKSATEYMFKLQDDQASVARMISVQDYFREKYGIDLRYPHLPCLVVGQKKNYLPMEICNMVPSQKRKLTDQQTAEMIKKVTKPAYERQRDIQVWANQLVDDSGNYLKTEYGLSINKNMVDVDGMVLPTPSITLGGGCTVEPKQGVWDMRKKEFYKGVAVTTWAMVCFTSPRDCNDRVTSGFAKQMENVCRQEGMTMNGTPCSIQYKRANDNVEQILTHLVANHQNLQLILVVLPVQGNKDIYKEVKRVGDTVLGIPTQCVQTKQFIPAKPQVCSNIAMKINAKLGGINHIVPMSEMPPIFSNVIVFGADVTHPSPGENNIPSIAAVVASMDAHATRYAARVRAQTHLNDKSAQEIILKMAEMVKELLIEFKNQTKIVPRRIIFYRDGVSEGQFDQVLLHEVRAVQEACLSLHKDYKPSITFIVVQKRHHARLFCANRDDQSGRAGNVPPGTMVDSGITHPFEFDFYLCSHQGIQGTSRPTHYHVLYDDNNFDANSLHKLTYHLCHTYARCTRSVSMPAPAYYAHLVAFRARHHLSGLVDSRNGQEKPEKELLEKFCEAINVKEKMKGGMYFA